MLTISVKRQSRHIAIYVDNILFDQKDITNFNTFHIVKIYAKYSYLNIAKKQYTNN